MVVIRGAVVAQNTKQDIALQSIALFNEILSKNDFQTQEVKAIFFSATKDIFVSNPATVVRTHFGLDKVAFMCFQEMYVENSLENCIRIAVFVEKDFEPTHCYVGGAKVLRPDLNQK